MRRPPRFCFGCRKKIVQRLFVLLLTSPTSPSLLILTLSLSFFLFFVLYCFFSSSSSSFHFWSASLPLGCPASFAGACGQMTAGRCHTLLSPVTEESGEEGTNSEVSSPPACRSPSPGPNADAPANQVLESRPRPACISPSRRPVFSKRRRPTHTPSHK